MVPLVLASVLAASWPSVSLTRVVSGFANPTQVTSARDGSNRLFVVEQGGRVKIVKGGVVSPVPFLDISGRVSCCGERGLLSIAFPRRSAPFEFYADYTDVNGDTTISRFFVSSDPNVAGASSEQILLKIAQPFANHNGGQLAFGPDGYLYVGMGDGGSAGDPNNNGQTLSTLLGKILRIDVVGQATYTIPPSNPFYGLSSARNEIWAYGLRNPWRFSFDRKTGDLWIGDVGQGAWEEVDFQGVGAAGGANYGWRITEGAHCYNPPSGCSFSGITLPVAEYSHANGCSITGGFVYRGRDFARLDGIYFYADYCSGRLWGIRNGTSGQEGQELLRPGYGFTSFGEDEAGEVYAVDGNSGTLYRLVDAGGPLSVLTVPVVVDAAGASGSRFVSELTLGNRGTTDASVAVTFTASAALGSTGSGTFTTTVAAGRQLVFTDTLQWLRSRGLFIPLGDQGGTLRLAYSGLLSGDAAFASVRTLAVLPQGRAGLAYPALSSNETLEGTAALYGLREDASFRSNVGLLNAGEPASGGSVTLRVKVMSGAAGDGRSAVLPDVVLGPGQWTQRNRVLSAGAYANGWATVERVAGAEPFFAYGVVNDNVTGDGAYLAPVAAGRTTDRLTLPVAVHTGAFTTELVLTHAGASPVRLSFRDASSDKDVVLLPHEQRFIPDVLSTLGSAASATALEISSNGGAVAFHASARTHSSAAGGGTFGVAYAAVAPSEGALSEAWVFGLKQDGLTRSNLAAALTDPASAGPDGFRAPLSLSVDFFDGDTGLLAGTRVVTLDRNFVPDWTQLNAPLSTFGIRNSYARVRAPAGNTEPFLVYGVVNDGAVPGAGTGDGSYVAMSPVR
ncbi:MAG: PQQ-dependent sugar dehydrogenase [Acidobacteriota bacterium]